MHQFQSSKKPTLLEPHSVLKVSFTMWQGFPVHHTFLLYNTVTIILHLLSFWIFTLIAIICAQKEKSSNKSLHKTTIQWMDLKSPWRQSSKKKLHRHKNYITGRFLYSHKWSWTDNWAYFHLHLGEIVTLSPRMNAWQAGCLMSIVCGQRKC